MSDPSSNQQDQPHRESDNTPIAPPSEGAGVIAPPRNNDNVDRTLWYTIGGIVLVSCCGIMLLVYLFTKTSQFSAFASGSPYADFTPFPTIGSDSTPSSRPAAQPASRVTPDKQATHMAWTKPLEAPSLGSAEEARQALDNNNIKKLRSFAAYLPNIPRINQPGDIYFYGIRLDKSQPALWDYSWCARSEEILDGNLNQMQIEFDLNEERVPSTFIALNDYMENDKSFCRTYTILITFWPEGIHLLESNITFLEPTDNGRNEFPAGTHTYQYLVTIRP